MQQRYCPVAGDKQYSPEQLEWLRAVDTHRRHEGRKFPTAAEYFNILISLGYSKANPTTSPRPAVRDRIRPMVLGRPRVVLES